MKQNIEIEYTEKEFETVFSFFGSIVNACSSFAHKAMDMEHERRTRHDKNEKHEKIKSNIKDHKEEINDVLEDIKYDIEDLKDTKKAIRDMQRTLATLSLQIQALEDSDEDQHNPIYPGSL